MNAKNVTSFLTGIAISKGFRYELGKDPEKVLKAIGFDENEVPEIIESLSKLKRSPNKAGDESPDVAPWVSEGVWTAGGEWAPAGVWTGQSK